MKKLVTAFLIGILHIGTLYAQTPTIDVVHQPVNICETDPLPTLYATNTGNQYSWHKQKPDGSYEYIINSTTNGYQVVPLYGAGNYKCEVITNATTTATGNILQLGDFEFPSNSVRNSHQDSNGNWIIYEYASFNNSGVNIGFGQTTTTTNPNNVKDPYFISMSAHKGSYMLVCDGSSTTLEVWKAKGLSLPSGDYQFSCWAANIDAFHTNPSHTIPKLKFKIYANYNQPNQIDLTSQTSFGNNFMDITSTSWAEYSVTITLTQQYNNVAIVIMNETAGSEGNDFALDDIYFGTTSTTPASIKIETFTVNIDTEPTISMPTIPDQCPGAEVIVDPTVTNVGPNVNYEWTGPQTSSDKKLTAYANQTVGDDNEYTFKVTNGVCPVAEEDLIILTKSCSSNLEKLYAACSGETCYLAPITTTGTATWTDADGNALTSTAIVTSGTNDMVFTCTVVTTDNSGNPLTITETHTIKIFDCKKEYTPCAGSQVQLETNNEGTYEWNTGETNKTLVVTASNVVDQADTYTCKITIAGTPNNISFTETHKVFASSCTNPDDFETCKDTDLRLTPSKIGDRYNWTLNGTPVTLPQELDGTITINHSTVTPENTPLEYICEIYEMANTAGAPSLANNIIENGDFENTTRDANGNFAGFTSGYNYNSTFEPQKDDGLPYPGYYRLVTSPTSGVLPEPVVGGNSYLECDGHSDLNESGDVYIAKITEPIVKGLEYQFAFSAVATNTTNTPKLTFSLVALDENNNVISTYPLIAEQSITNTTWQQYGVGTYWTAPDDFHHAEIRLSNSVLEAAGNDFGLDNILFQRVYRSTATINTLVRKDIYSVTVTDCTEEEEREDTFLIGSTITLKSEITGGQTYLWYNYNDEPIKDANGNHIGASSIEIVIQDNSDIAEINNYYCVVTMPAGSNPTQVTEFITLNLFEPIELEPCQFDTITLVPTLEGATSESWYRLTTYNDLSQKEPLLNVVSSEYKIDCQTLVPYLDFEYGNNQISLIRTITDENGTYRDEQWNLTVGKCQETKAPEVKSICEGESYTWNNTPYTTTTQKTNVYKEKRGNKNWEITESLNLTVHPNPEFEVFVEGRTANIETNSDFTLIMLDNQNKGTETEFTWLPVGDHTIKMTDSNTCSSEKSFSIIPKPIQPMPYFSPNDDGNNDKWVIKNLEYYPEAIVQIYDRYSRLLASIRGIDFNGWDGYYNGHIMPMDDYWYVIMIPESNQTVSGHFILKR